MNLRMICGEYMAKLMNLRNKLDQMFKSTMIDGLIERCSHKVVMETMMRMKSRNGGGPYEVCVMIVLASGKMVDFYIMSKLFDLAVDDNDLAEDWFLMLVEA